MNTAMMVRIFAALALTAFASCAQAADWTVKRTFGEVWLQSSAAQKISLERGARLKGKTTIATGRNGKAVLVRDRESMIIGPNATVTVPGPNIFGRTTIRQNAGSVAYDVEKRNVRHFAVKTPTLTAVVKGTTLQVRENSQVSSVSVLQGSVRVSDHSTGQTVNLAAGEETTIVHGSRKGVTVATNDASQSSTGVKDKDKDDDDDDDDDDQGDDDDDDDNDN